MNFSAKHITGLLFVCVAALPFVFMTRDRGAAKTISPGKPDKLLVLSPHRREVRLEYSRGFREWASARHGRNVEIEWLDVGGTDKIAKDLETRFAVSPGSPGLDLIFGGGVGHFRLAQQNGWLAPVKLPDDVLDGIPPTCGGIPVYDPGGHWYGVAMSTFGVLYNRVLVERLKLPVPASWEDLGRPEFSTWLASGDPRASGSVHTCYELILQAYGFERGWGLLTRLSANVRRFGESGGVVPREVLAGDAAAGVVIDQYAETVIAAAGGNALVFVMPEGATVIDADPIGMVTNAPDPALALLFMEYALGADGQRILYQPAGAGGQKYSLHRMPVRRAAYDEPGGPAGRPFEFSNVMKYDPAKDTRRRDAVNSLIGTALIDAHQDLAGAWQAVIAAGMPSNLVTRLCEPPYGEEEVDALAAEWKDQRKKTEALRLLSENTRRRYLDIMDAARRTTAPAGRDKT